MDCKYLDIHGNNRALDGFLRRWELFKKKKKKKKERKKGFLMYRVLRFQVATKILEIEAL